MRPNKTNFGLSFGYFFERAKCEGDKGREKKRKGMETTFVWNYLCMDL